MKKICSRCHAEKPLEDFGKRSDRISQITPQCKACERIRKTDYMRGYREENREAIKIWHRAYRIAHPDRIRRANLKSHYKATPELFDQLLKKQNGKCCICGVVHKANSKKKSDRLFIDHCHKTEKLRGLLCHHCNTGLGHFRDDIDRLQSAIAYLKS